MIPSVGAVVGERAFKAYPNYTDSRIEWLGELPSHWTLAPVYARYEVALGKMLDAKRVTGAHTGRYLRNVDVQWDRVNTDGLPQMDFVPSERSRYGLAPGDILVCEGGEVGRSAMWRGELEECFYQKAIHRVRPLRAEEHPRYFYYLMYSFAKQGLFVAGGNPNTIDHLPAVQLKHYRFPFAPSDEQRLIAAFLDRETAKIDAMVAKKERLITLLLEKRDALISETFALRPKPSWEPRRLRRLLWQVKRPVLVEPDTEYREIGIRSWGKGIFHKDPLRGALFEDKSLFRVAPGDFVLNIVFAWEGAVAIVSENETGMVASHRFPTFQHAPDLDLDYFLGFLQSEPGRALMEINSPGAAGRNRTIRLGQFLAEEIPLPPLSVQRRIVQTFRFEEKRLQGLVARIREALACLEEFRTALISAAVTGKIDVRAGVASH